MKKVLITYYSKTDTTKKAGEIIKNELEKADFNVSLVKLKEMPNINSYDVVIVGSPINGMKWYEDAINFVIDNKEVLKTKQVAYYFLSYLINSGRPMWQRTINKALDNVSRMVRPVSIGKFEGTVKDEFKGLFKFMLLGRRTPELDLFDEEAVKEWAKELKKILKN